MVQRRHGQGSIAVQLTKFLERVDVKGPTECWNWIGGKMETNGNIYGTFGKRSLAHRASYELHCEPIPEGMVIDHLCRNGLCVNPAHLEPVTNVENVMRGNGACALKARQTHCKSGHPLEGANLRRRADGKRICRACERAYNAARGR